METLTHRSPQSTRTGARAGVLPFRRVAVLGAGTMGAQIALHIANAGLPVDLLDIAPKEGGDRNAVVEKLFKQAVKLNPSPLFTDAVVNRVRLGNFDDHFDRIAAADWVIEVVVERMDIKRDLHARIEAAAGPDAVISTNTSGLPIHAIAEGRSVGFKRRFLGTHFFNPPRYLHLLEIIPTPDTEPAIVERVSEFGRVHLGKGIVVAKDTPNFIGNRIGIFGMMKAIHAFADGRYTIEEIDTLTGTLTGRPRSATFRTADVVGLDTLRHVAVNLFDGVPDDESRETFAVPAVLNQLVENGALGAKTGAGFYKKEGKEIKSIDLAEAGYTAAKPLDLGDIAAIEKAGDLAARLRALYADTGRAGAFFRESMHELIGYSARRIPEIADSPADIDRAMEWGFGWEMGPFASWDALGFETVLAGLREAGVTLPAWVPAMEASGSRAFYRGSGAAREVYVPGEGYVSDTTPADEIDLAAIKQRPAATLWTNKEAGLIDIGDGVALYEFRSKANALGFEVMQGLMDVIDKVENDRDLRGLVVANAGKNFAVGANLAELAAAVMGRQFDVVDQAIDRFQQAVLRIRYARKPVVVATHQRVLGGGCELAMASPNPVAAAETYMGLVELGVGLIPAGTGTTHLAALASERSAGGFPSQIQAHIQRFFENVAMAKVSSSARQAQELGYLPPHAIVVMNDARRFHAAKHTVIQLSEAGYLPPPERTQIQVLGRPGKAALEVAARQFEAGKFISAYDRHLAVELAHVLTGGDLSGPAFVHERYLIELEREVFLRLLGEKKTQDRIEAILKTGKPLRN
ncbi:MAG: 3-hydroxyacyl-CoA dehydrogenase NAD-binding domain-containing protein [Rhodothermales bacterium]